MPLRTYSKKVVYVQNILGPNFFKVAFVPDFVDIRQKCLFFPFCPKISKWALPTGEVTTSRLAGLSIFSKNEPPLKNGSFGTAVPVDLVHAETAASAARDPPHTHWFVKSHTGAHQSWCKIGQNMWPKIATYWKWNSIRFSWI